MFCVNTLKGLLCSLSNVMQPLELLGDSVFFFLMHKTRFVCALVYVDWKPH